MADPSPYLIIEGFEAFHVVDDRGCPGKSLGIFSTTGLAEIAAQGKGYYGGNGSVHSVFCLRVNQTGEVFKLADREPIQIDKYAEQVTEMVRKEALLKLTPEERRVLGV